MLRLVAFLFLALLCVPTPALPAVKYVDPGCANNTPAYNPATRACSGGTSTSYSTIANGITGMAGGDTLSIRAGTYVEAPVLDSSKAGTSGAALTTVKGQTGETVIIRPTAPNGAGTAFWNYANWSVIDNVTIDGAVMTSGSNLVAFAEAGGPTYHDITIQNAEIKNLLQTSSACLTTLGTALHTNFKYLNLKVHDCGPQSPANPGTHGIYVGRPATTISGCEIYNTQTAGIQLYNSGGSVGASIVTDNYIHNTIGPGIIFWNGGGSTIARNRIRSAGAAGLNASGFGNAGKIVNNVLYANAAQGLNIGDVGGGANPSNNNTIQNNILRANGGGDFGDNSTGTVMDHNTCQATNAAKCTAGDPLFVNASAGDFHLGTGSAAIDAGISLAASCPSGMDCTFQGSAPDTGAYESTAASPSGTTAVQVSFVYGPVDAQHGAATSATALWRPTGGGDWATYCQVAAPTVTCTGAALANGASYDFTVVPTNSTGTGPPSSVVSLSLGTPAAGVPTAATNVVASPLTAMTLKPKEQPPAAATDVEAEPGGTP